MSKQNTVQPFKVRYKPSEWAQKLSDETTKNIIKMRKREMKMAEYYTRTESMAFSIEPQPHLRQRLDKWMTAEERALRKEWVLDQRLSPNEPRPMKPKMNWYRSLWHGTFNKMADVIRPVVGDMVANKLNARMRYYVFLFGSAVTFLYYKNYGNGRPELYVGKRRHVIIMDREPSRLPGEEGFPHKGPLKTFEQLHDEGFATRKALFNYDKNYDW